MANLALLGKTVLIGDGTGNLGALISRAFAVDGARICIHCGDEYAMDTVADIRAAGGDAFAIQGDFTQVRNAVRVFEAAQKKLGGIDIAINIVGNTFKVGYASEASVSAKAAYLFIQEAGRQLNDNGKICTIVTSADDELKAAIEQFTRDASNQFGSRGISVTSIGHGPMDTPFGHESLIEDIVPLVQFLVTDGWWINGQTIFANGSYVTR